MSRPLQLSPDRLFPSDPAQRDIARRLHERGVLEKYGVELIGASIEVLADPAARRAGRPWHAGPRPSKLVTPPCARPAPPFSLENRPWICSRIRCRSS